MSEANTQLHLTWSAESPRGKCPHCNSTTLLAIAPRCWDIDCDSAAAAGREYAFYEGVEIDAEITGHWCDECRLLVSVSVNQPG